MAAQEDLWQQQIAFYLDGVGITHKYNPSQNSRKAKDAMEEVGANIFSIPARSPDCNPIENVFNCVKAKLKEDALSLKITHESYADFSD